MYKKAQQTRLIVAILSFLVIFVVILIRLFVIQVLYSKNYVKLADSQHNLTLTLYPQRGLMYDRNMNVLALSLKVFSVYAEPRIMENKDEIANILSTILQLEEDKVHKKLAKDKLFVWIKRRITEAEAVQIKKLKLHGIGLLNENKRYYPKGGLASHVIGFAGIDEHGLEGLELQYNKYLKGKKGWRSLLRDAKQRMLPAFEYEYVSEVDGYDLVLTIDEGIQHIVEDELDRVFLKSNAKGATVVVMDPATGQIYAMANRPGYNPNKFNDSVADERRNRAICDYFEPGSTFKIITATAALEEKVVTLDDIFFCENGSYKISRHTLHDHKPHGDLTVAQIIEKSSNIGVAKIAQKLGEERLYKYIKKFKFGEISGIDLPGEVAGVIRPVSKWSKLSIGSIPMGQEICTTVLQMARAMAVIANGGYLVQPRVVQKIVDNCGEIIQDFDIKPKERIISAKTAEDMRYTLKRVVDSGTGTRAAMKGYSAGGKTGTAQKIEPTGGYSHSKFIASFIGFTPVDNPRFVIAVVFDEPRPYYYGGLVCGPVFKGIAERILRYTKVPEDIEL